MIFLVCRVVGGAVIIDLNVHGANRRRSPALECHRSLPGIFMYI